MYYKSIFLCLLQIYEKSLSLQTNRTKNNRNVAKTTNASEKNLSPPRRLPVDANDGSAFGRFMPGTCPLAGVPWQGWQGWQLHYFFSTFSIPSTSCSTKGPSLHSKMTLSGSSGSIVCHTPFGMFTPYRPSSLHSTTSSIIEPSSLCVVTLTFPRRITNVSSFVGCLCIGTSVPGSTAFKNRWHFSSRL